MLGDKLSNERAPYMQFFPVSRIINRLQWATSPGARQTSSNTASPIVPSVGLRRKADNCTFPFSPRGDRYVA